MSLFLDDGDVRLYHGDALSVLQGLEAESVHCCVTSPPFYGLRDYGTGRWEGGNPDCDHVQGLYRNDGGRRISDGREFANATRTAQYGQTCGKCGAQRVDQQIGLEETPEQWVASLVQVFREVRRVLRPEGTLWCEVGDGYNAYNGGAGPSSQLSKRQSSERPQLATGYGRKVRALKPKDLIGAPWQLAFALRADGWYLRSDIVWARPNPMPESVTDRPTKSHSYVFLLAKQPRYFFDAEAVREKASENTHQRYAVARETPKGREGHNGWDETTNAVLGARNVRSVWTIATQPYPEAHFATFPEELARRCILAGTSERGCCPECGAPWVREVERSREYDHTTTQPSHADSPYAAQDAGGIRNGVYVVAETIGWRPSCDCRVDFGDGANSGVPPSTVPCVVLDPFVGSGTVPYVARKHGRHAIGIDLSASYLELAARRLQQLSLFA